jgi:hypothetical protein
MWALAGDWWKRSNLLLVLFKHEENSNHSGIAGSAGRRGGQEKSRRDRQGAARQGAGRTGGEAGQPLHGTGNAEWKKY